MLPATRRTFIIGAAAATGAGAAAVGLGLLPPAMRQETPARVFAEDGVAIRGADPVAYFRRHAAVPGDPAVTLHWGGATWRFASAAHRDAFRADPAAHAPQYGGFCAWAVAAKGRLYATQPGNWTIHEGRLYLNYNDAIQRRWEADIPGFVAEGDRRWPAMAGMAQAGRRTGPLPV